MHYPVHAIVEGICDIVNMQNSITLSVYIIRSGLNKYLSINSGKNALTVQ